MIETNILFFATSLHRHRNKRGQTLAEYALIIALISVVAIAALMSMGGQITNAFTTVDHQVAIAGNGGPAAVPPGHNSGGGG